MFKVWQDMYSYCNVVMELWDGFVVLVMIDGCWVCGGLDWNGLCLLCYVVIGDGMLIVGLEVGMVLIDEVICVEKGVFGFGQLIVVDMVEGKLFYDVEMKDKLVVSQLFGDWIQKVIDLFEIMDGMQEIFIYVGVELCKCQIVVGYSMEELE